MVGFDGESVSRQQVLRLREAVALGGSYPFDLGRHQKRGHYGEEGVGRLVCCVTVLVLATLPVLGPVEKRHFE